MTAPQGPLTVDERKALCAAVRVHLLRGVRHAQPEDVLALIYGHGLFGGTAASVARTIVQAASAGTEMTDAEAAAYHNAVVVRLHRHLRRLLGRNLIDRRRSTLHQSALLLVSTPAGDAAVRDYLARLAAAPDAAPDAAQDAEPDAARPAE